MKLKIIIALLVAFFGYFGINQVKATAEESAYQAGYAQGITDGFETYNTMRHNALIIAATENWTVPQETELVGFCQTILDQHQITLATPAPTVTSTIPFSSTVQIPGTTFSTLNCTNCATGQVYTGEFAVLQKMNGLVTQIVLNSAPISAFALQQTASNGTQEWTVCSIP